jgi:hypothetical protein
MTVDAPLLDGMPEVVHADPIRMPSDQFVKRSSSRLVLIIASGTCPFIREWWKNDDDPQVWIAIKPAIDQTGEWTAPKILIKDPN